MGRAWNATKLLLGVENLSKYSPLWLYESLSELEKPRVFPQWQQANVNLWLSYIRMMF